VKRAPTQSVTALVTKGNQLIQPMPVQTPPDTHETLVSGKLARGWTLHKRPNGFSVTFLMNTDELDDAVRTAIDLADKQLIGTQHDSADKFFNDMKRYVPPPKLAETPVGVVGRQVVIEHIVRLWEKDPVDLKWNYELSRDGTTIGPKTPVSKQVAINGLSSENQTFINELDVLVRQTVNRRYAEAMLKISPDDVR
jgi:hypothetical protein